MPRALEVLDRDGPPASNAARSTPSTPSITLLAEELTVRESRRIKTALMMARLTAVKTLAGFDFSFQPSLDRNRILALAELELHRPRRGRACPRPARHRQDATWPWRSAVEAVKAGRSVYFSTLADIIASLAKAEREGSSARDAFASSAALALLIVDEIGYLPVIPGGGNLFFQLVNARYEKGAMILTSNRGFAEWGDVFGDPVVATALLDRLLHHAVVIQIEGSSYRLRQHADLIPEHLRRTAPHHPATRATPSRSTTQKQEPRSTGRLILCDDR